jgi:hypothetical protein
MRSEMMAITAMPRKLILLSPFQLPILFGDFFRCIQQQNTSISA